MCKVLKTCGMANRRTDLHCFDSTPNMLTQVDLALYERENSTLITIKNLEQLDILITIIFLIKDLIKVGNL